MHNMITTNTMLLSLEGRQLTPALRALHLDLHPLRQAHPMEDVVAGRSHQPERNLVRRFQFALLVQGAQANWALRLCHTMIYFSGSFLYVEVHIAPVVENRREQELGDDLLGPVILLSPQQEALEGDKQDTKHDEEEAGLELKNIPGETPQVELNNVTVTTRRNLRERNLV